MEYKVTFLGSSELVNGVKSFRFSLPVGYDFKPGQFFVLELGNGLVKHFSYSNSPTEKDYVEFTTRMSGSDYKIALDKLSKGDEVKIREPLGGFILDKSAEKIVFIAGGIGVTPVRSMVKYLCDLKIDCDVVFLYGNQSEDSIAFKDDFINFKKSNSRLKVVDVIANPSESYMGYKGFISSDIIRKEVPELNQQLFYICGPPKMVEAMLLCLKELDVSKEKIMVESFSGY